MKLNSTEVSKQPPLWPGCEAVEALCFVLFRITWWNDFAAVNKFEMGSRANLFVNLFIFKIFFLSSHITLICNDYPSRNTKMLYLCPQPCNSAFHHVIISRLGRLQSCYIQMIQINVSLKQERISPIFIYSLC